MTHLQAPADRHTLQHAINLRLALLGCPTVEDAQSATWTKLTSPIFARHREITRQLADRLCPADARIQHFLHVYLSDLGPAPRLPARTFVLDEPGMARELSLPPGGDTYESPLLKSYRLHNGVLHNPVNDRRTTQGVFHVADGGLPVPDDKFAVPRLTFSKLLAYALNPPPELARLPFTAGGSSAAECFVSLLLRPLVVPAVPGFTPEKRMEIRFFAPGSLVSNLDFVESIFGNAGDPHLPENDAALDIRLVRPHRLRHHRPPPRAPHPRRSSACRPRRRHAPQQIRDGMCWQKPRTSSTTTAPPSNSPPATPRGSDRHPHRRQLLRLLQKRGEDPDQLRRQPPTVRRGGARRRRHRLSQLRPRRSNSKLSANPNTTASRMWWRGIQPGSSSSPKDTPLIRSSKGSCSCPSRRTSACATRP
jgi:hypothetical protein